MDCHCWLKMKSPRLCDFFQNRHQRPQISFRTRQQNLPPRCSTMPNPNLKSVFVNSHLYVTLRARVMVGVVVNPKRHRKRCRQNIISDSDSAWSKTLGCILFPGSENQYLCTFAVPWVSGGAPDVRIWRSLANCWRR